GDLRPRGRGALGPLLGTGGAAPRRLVRGAARGGLRDAPAGPAPGARRLGDPLGAERVGRSAGVGGGAPRAPGDRRRAGRPPPPADAPGAGGGEAPRRVRGGGLPPPRDRLRRDPPRRPRPDAGGPADRAGHLV